MSISILLTMSLVLHFSPTYGAEGKRKIFIDSPKKIDLLKHFSIIFYFPDLRHLRSHILVASSE